MLCFIVKDFTNDKLAGSLSIPVNAKNLPKSRQ